MRPIHRVLPFALALALGPVPPARALVPGGGPARSDCYVEWQLNAPDLETSSQKTVACDCADGDPCDADGEADGACTFDVALCIPDAEARFACTPTPLASLKPDKKAVRAGVGVPADLSSAGCGAVGRVTAPLRKGGRRPSKRVTLKATAKAAGGKPKKDRDTLKLRCKPAGSGSACGGAGKACPPNPSGPEEPNEIIMTAYDTGTDLDNGWRGATHNFPTPAGAQVQLCLENCDRTSDPDCDVKMYTGPDTFNRTTFGPFLPLFTAGIPVCVANNYASTLFTGGTASLATGEMEGPFRLDAAVFLTDETNVCPKCLGGRCNSGEKSGQTCGIDGTMFVAESAAADKTFRLSKDCPPVRDQLAGVIDLDLPITTGTSTLSPLPGGTAAIPCVKQAGQPGGLSPLSDLCGPGGACTAACTGLACAGKGTDFVTGAEVCLDAKGGIAQLCCDTDTSRPCFPTGTGGTITRTGAAVPPEPRWPDPTYPKSTACAPGACTVVVATFCEPATGRSTVDGLAGFPGPAALIITLTGEWKTP